MLRLATALVFLAVLFSGSAHAREEILSFFSDVTVEADGDLLVSETIRVRAEGRQIRRGIYRDLPLAALDEWGLWDRNGFDLIAVEKDGDPSPFHTENIERGIRIYIGDADTFLRKGEYTYRIEYRTTRQIRFFDDYDEVYWNATGNFWTFPIIEATARIKLPEGAAIQQTAGYTGYFGRNETDYRITEETKNEIVFRSSRAFRAREGLTVAVGFTKGVVAENPTGEMIAKLWANAGAILFVIGWIGIAWYYLWAWRRVGRDPPGETIIPLFHPPGNFSPAAISWLHFQSFRKFKKGSTRALIAALLSLGVKKHIEIEEDGFGDVTFHRREGGEQTRSKGELAFMNKLFRSKDSIKLDKTNGPKLISAHTALRNAITKEYEGEFFNHNVGWFIGGAVMAGVWIVLSIGLQQPPDEGLLPIFPTIPAAGGGSILAIIGWRKLFAPHTSFFSRAGGFLLLVAGAMLLGVALISTQLSTLFAYRIAGLLVFMAAVGVISFFWLLRAPTPAGARLLSEIEGFMMYLVTAETDRMNLRDAPRMSEALFERYLPYAAGLGVEQPWSDAFAAHLARITPDQSAGYQPGWYSGRSWQNMDIGSSMGSAVSAVSNSMASAMPAPKSSSGSSGGGFSGGGGGGGGGGGW